MNKVIFLAMLTILVSGCGIQTGIFGGPEVDLADVDYEFHFVEGELRTRIVFDFVSPEHMFNAFVVVMIEGYKQYPDTINTITTFHANGEDVISIEVPMEDLQKAAQGGSLADFYQAATITSHVNSEDALHMFIESLGVENINVQQAEDTVEISYTLLPLMVEITHHHIIIREVLLEAAYAFPKSSKIIIHEKIQALDDDLAPVDLDFARIETPTANVNVFALDEKSEVEFFEDITITGLYTYVPPPICGDNECNGAESFESCPEDCEAPVVEPEEEAVDACASNEECGESQVCFTGVCLDVECKEDADCLNGVDECTNVVCTNAGEVTAFCEDIQITACTDDDGCCPSGCTHEDDEDCEEEVEEDPEEEDSQTSDWETGTETLPTELNEDHAFFDFETQSITSDFDTGDIFFNDFGDLLGECTNQGADCAELKQETDLNFDDMDEIPSSGFSGDAQPSVGDRYWIKTIEGNDAKIEVTAIDAGNSITFKWGYKGD